MIGRLFAVAAALGVCMPLGGCGEHEFLPPPAEERVEQAEALYSPALFDSIAWGDEEEYAIYGAVVFASQCRKCHGVMGMGGTDYAAERNLDVPSLVQAGWEYDGDIEAVRHRIFVGHTAGMPTWGVAGITPREIDAVARYILTILRPEVLGGL